MTKFKIGGQYDRWKIIGIAPYRSNGHKRMLVCQCDCGTIKEVPAQKLGKRSRSCGCLKVELQTKHGGCKRNAKNHPLYTVLASMIERCTNTNSKSYKNYGGRGISVCEEWNAGNFAAFKDWAIKNGYKKGLHIDRIDNDKGYSPSNCRFVTPKQNQNNTRACVFRNYFGEKLTTQQAAEKYKVDAATIAQRIKMGLSPELAVVIKTPLKKGQLQMIIKAKGIKIEKE